jgi:cystathionine beta-lyase/cystathionine gamma-synthase
MPIDPYKKRKFKSENTSLPMIRFQTGLEHKDDLIKDLQDSFDKV